tara:strand:+ start:245 stop:424 length:180 start_codon:yes stop_codon:yes gene_type:complete
MIHSKDPRFQKILQRVKRIGGIMYLLMVSIEEPRWFMIKILKNRLLILVQRQLVYAADI